MKIDVQRSPRSFTQVSLLLGAALVEDSMRENDAIVCK